MILLIQNIIIINQSDSTNANHPLRFYLDAAKTTAYTTGVTTGGTPGSSGAYTQIAVTKSTPKTLFYQCSNHGYMGNYVTVANSTNFTADGVAGTDTVTATKLRLTSGANATGSATTHAFQIGASNGVNLRLDNNQVSTYNNGNGETMYLNVSGGLVAVGSGGLKIMGDGNDITFGDSNEIVLTHVHDTGLLLTDTGGSPTLQLHDSNESVSSDGTNLILTSGGTAFKMPTSDGTGGHFLKTDGSGNLSFAAASGGGGGGVTVQDEGNALSTTGTTLNFVGSGVTASGTGATKTITIPGGGGGGGSSLTLVSNSGGTLNLQNGATSVFDGNVLGTIQFNAPNETSGTDANEIAAAIVAEADNQFSSSFNSTDLVFKLGVSGPATEKMRLTHEGGLTLNNAYTFPTSDGNSNQVLKTDGSGNLSFTTVSGVGSGISQEEAIAFAIVYG